MNQAADIEPADALTLDARKLGIQVVVAGLVFMVALVTVGALLWEPLQVLSEKFVTHLETSL